MKFSRLIDFIKVEYGNGGLTSGNTAGGILAQGEGGGNIGPGAGGKYDDVLKLFGGINGKRLFCLSL